MVRIIPARAGPTPPRPASRWSSSDHPRSCGANVIVWVGFALLHGSSPLVRGQPDKRKAETRSVRIIPARAGPTSSERHAPSTMTDHPRSCGANRRQLHSGVPQRGSSPLVRGQHKSSACPDQSDRIIPARAGPTQMRQPHQRAGADHPRSCGANGKLTHVYMIANGSSPLVRGQPPFHFSGGLVVRIIPARAGPTPSRWPSTGRSPDHPRSCGANGAFPSRSMRHTGSSPLVAGPTCRDKPDQTRPPDHPRSCGANRHGRGKGLPGAGSSPLVRGQLDFFLGGLVRSRIIPARAGPTMPKMLLIDLCTDHPRSCGANLSETFHHAATSGSSPLVRGQRVDAVGERLAWRIIPARAGPTKVPADTELTVTDHPRSCGANGVQPRPENAPSGSSPLVRGQH